MIVRAVDLVHANASEPMIVHELMWWRREDAGCRVGIMRVQEFVCLKL